MQAKRFRRSRAGLSDLVGSLLTVAITIIAGAAVFGYVNSQAGVSENIYGQSIGNTLNFLAEKFVIVDMNYSGNGNSLSIWLYNTGNINLRVVQVLVYNSSKSFYMLYNATTVKSLSGTSCSASSSGLESPLLYNPTQQSSPQPGSINLAPGYITILKLTIPSGCSVSFVKGVTYYVNLLGLYGNEVIYYQTR
ncbi:MAG: archaellin/type IV pilin N-terminal domain-containing protein [Conexivisphaerales archaeon]